jgi:hypothetical protein
MWTNQTSGAPLLQGWRRNEDPPPSHLQDVSRRAVGCLQYGARSLGVFVGIISSPCKFRHYSHYYSYYLLNRQDLFLKRHFTSSLSCTKLY